MACAVNHCHTYIKSLTAQTKPQPTKTGQGARGQPPPRDGVPLRRAMVRRRPRQEERLRPQHRWVDSVDGRLGLSVVRSFCLSHSTHTHNHPSNALPPPKKKTAPDSSVSEATSIQLEFKSLAHALDDEALYRLAERSMRAVDRARSDLPPGGACVRVLCFCLLSGVAGWMN